MQTGTYSSQIFDIKINKCKTNAMLSTKMKFCLLVIEDLSAAQILDHQQAKLHFLLFSSMYNRDQ